VYGNLIKVTDNDGALKSLPDWARFPLYPGCWASWAWLA